MDRLGEIGDVFFLGYLCVFELIFDRVEDGLSWLFFSRCCMACSVVRGRCLLTGMFKKFFSAVGHFGRLNITQISVTSYCSPNSLDRPLSVS